MATHAQRIASARRHHTLWITIEGVEPVFKQRAELSCATVLGGSRPEHAILTSVAQGGEDLDFAKRAVVGGSLSFTLRQRYGSTVLSDLHQPRRRRAAWLIADAAASDTTIETNNNSTFTAGQLIYIGAETIRVGAVHGGGEDLTGCTRGLFGSTARRHHSTSSVLGASIYDRPPSWLGRRVTLYGSFTNERGQTTADLTAVLGTFMIEQNPTWSDDVSLDFSCVPVLDEILSRSAYLGIKDSDAGASEGYVAGQQIAVSVSDPEQFITPDSEFPTFALLLENISSSARAGLSSLRRLYDYSTVTDQIIVGNQDHLSPAGISYTGAGDVRGTFARARHVALLQGSTGQWALWVLCSKLGDEANGNYDVLPGKERDGLTEPIWRMGCGIDESLIDVDSFTALSGMWCMYPLDRETKAEEIVYEACLQLDAYAYPTAAGKLALARLGDTRDTPVMTLDDENAIAESRPRIYMDEESIHPIVRWRANYDPSEQEYDAEHTTIDAEIMARYPRRDDVIEIESKALGVDLPPALVDQQVLARPFPLSVGELDQRARSIQVRGSRGRLMVERTFDLSSSRLRIGDVVTLGFAGTDLQGGTLNGRMARVVGRRPSWMTGSVDLRLEVMEQVYRVAPSCVITAVTTITNTSDTITLSTSSPDSAGASPQSDFHAGQVVRIWDVSAGTSETATIEEILSSPPRLKMTAGISMTVQTGRDWVTWGDLGTSSGTTANGDDENDWGYLMPPSGVAAEGDTRRWQ